MREKELDVYIVDSVFATRVLLRLPGVVDLDFRD